MMTEWEKLVGEDIEEKKLCWFLVIIYEKDCICSISENLREKFMQNGWVRK